MPFGLFKRLLKDNPESTQSPSAKPNKPKANKAAKPKAAGAKATSAKDNAGKPQSKKSNKPKKPLPKWDINEFQVEPAEGKTRFHDLNLDDRIMRGIHNLGFQYCSPIQAESLPLTLKGHDLVGKAQTGTGKTAAFLITVLQKLLTTQPAERFASEPRALILAPTRELALQIAKDADGLAKFTDLNIVTVLGGVDYDKQKQQLMNEVVDIVVATPGRLLDYLQQKIVYLDQVEMLVIDEADRMLDMGFIPDLKRIIRATPEKQVRQTQLFSATFPQDVMNLSASWTYLPEQVVIEPESVATETVQQHFYLVEESEKVDILARYLKRDDIDKAIIFGNRRDTTRDLADALNKKGVKALLLSGEVAQHKRLKTLDRFKSGESRILVATDVAGRGIHVEGITHVFNFNLPDDPEDYVHRIGRTGRAGTSGIAISFIDEYEAYGLPELETYLGKKVVTEPLPEGV